MISTFSNIPLFFSCLESHRQRSLVGYSPWGGKESDMTELLTLNTPPFSHPTQMILCTFPFLGKPL